MTQERVQTEQEKRLREYFSSELVKPSDQTGGTLIVLAGLGLAFWGLATINNDGATILIIGILFLVGGFWAIIAGDKSYKARLKEAERRKLSDDKVDNWLRQGLSQLIGQSFKKLGLDKSETIAEPLLIRGPILWTTSGIDDGDLLWKKGDDDLVRFGVYHVTIIQLTDRHLGAYACDFNFIKDVALNERTDEYYFRDIVSVSTQEEASSYTLPTGHKLTTAQNFKLSVSNGEAIRVTIGAPMISDIVGTDEIPETGAEKAISVIRAMLREKK